MDFYQQHIDIVFNQFNSNAENGLGENAFESARKKYGNNVLKVTNSRNAFKILFGQFTSPLIIILIAASLL
jgi:magnesium-transporting ATPase (P-type)